MKAYYVDTCLSDYLQDGHNRDGEALAFASLGGTVEDTVEQLLDSIEFDQAPDVSDDEIRFCFGEAIADIDLRYIDENGTRCDEPAEDRDHEEPYLYVVLKWEPKVISSVKIEIEVSTTNAAFEYDPCDAVFEMVRRDLDKIQGSIGEGGVCGMLDHNGNSVGTVTVSITCEGGW
jgi:hypothetical protein